MANLLGDLRFGLRMLQKNPGHTAAAVVALGLGIGLTTAVFSIVDGVLLKDLPFPEADRIVYLESVNPTRDQEHLETDFQDFLDWQRRQQSFTGLSAFVATTVNLSGPGSRPERVDGAHMSANAFDLIGARPLAGRLFLPGEDQPGAEPVAILGYDLWHTRYGGDPHILGKTIRVNGVESTVVGIMPDGFAFPLSAVVWAPLQIDPARALRGQKPVDVFGKLRPGADLERGQAEMSAIAQALAKEHPETNRGRGVVVKPYTEQFINEQISSLLYSMLGAVAFVLLLACANVASLTMARASERTRELTIRAALGAGRGRVMAQILIESLLLSLVGAGLGIALARYGIYLFNGAIERSADNNPPFWIDISVNAAALLFALGATVASAVLSGLVPALQASRANASEVLKDEGRGSTSLRMGRFSRAIVALEVAFSCSALVGAGLMVKSVVEISRMSYAFTTEGLLTFRIALYENDYPEEKDRVRFWNELIPRLGEVAGVESAAAVTTLPGLGSDRMVYALDGRAYPTEQELPATNMVGISPGFFHTYGVELLEGRDFDRRDQPEAGQVVIVNQSFARAAWPQQSALGRRLRVGTGAEAKWRTVVGVAPDLGMPGLDPMGKDDGLYLPLGQWCPPRVSVAVKAPGGNPLALVPPVRAQVAGLDPDLPIYFVKSMQTALADNAYFFNLFGGVFGLFGLVALALASVGIYGVVAFSVHQRRQEIGVRIALGARRGNVLGMVVGQGMRQLLVGLAVGLPLAWLISRGLANLLIGVKPGDPQTFVTVALLLTGVAAFACFVPASRAAAVDPLVAIRYD